MITPHRPQLATTVAQLDAILGPIRRQGRRVGLVPTMGALHEGHLSLVRQSAAECDLTVVSIYVNPTQFGPAEDFAKYPRLLDADLEALAASGAAGLVFAPSDAEMYLPGHSTRVEPGGAAEPLEGLRRPGHFRGVATVVLKLLNLVRPQAAYFGRKDYQQLRVIEQMVAELNVPVEIRPCPTVREPDGLAMSSRNAYLSPAARRQATMLWQSLQRAKELVAEGERCAAEVARQMQQVIAKAPDARIDYVALVDPLTLATVEQIARPTLAALAVRIENTRLIDNELLDPGGK